MAKVSCVSIKHNMIDDNPSPKLQVLLTASIKLVTQMILHHETVRFFSPFLQLEWTGKKEPTITQATLSCSRLFGLFTTSFMGNNFY